jgi:hypothetical protein
VAERRKRFLKTLSGRFLILTVIFVMLAEVLIFVPSIARYPGRFHADPAEAGADRRADPACAEDMVSPELETELLANAEVYNVVLRRDEVRQLVLSSPSRARSMTRSTCAWPALGS